MDRRRVQIVRFEKVARGLLVLTIILFSFQVFHWCVHELSHVWACIYLLFVSYPNIYLAASLYQCLTATPWPLSSHHCYSYWKNEKPEILGAKLGFSLLWHYMHLLIINTGVILYYWPNSLPNGWAIYIYLRTRWIYKVVETYKFMQP